MAVYAWTPKGQSTVYGSSTAVDSILAFYGFRFNAGWQFQRNRGSKGPKGHTIVKNLERYRSKVETKIAHQAPAQLQKMSPRTSRYPSPPIAGYRTTLPVPANYATSSSK